MDPTENLYKSDTIPDKALMFVLSVLFSTLVVVTILQVLSRQFSLDFLGLPFWLVEPLAKVLLIIGTYLGAALASRNGEHIRMTTVEKRLRGWHLIVFRVVATAVTIAVLFVFIRGAVESSFAEWNSAFSEVTFMRLGAIYALIAGSLLLMAAFEGIQTVQIIREVRSDE